MIRIAGFKDHNGRLVRNFVEADWSDIKNCPKCSNCKNHNTRAMKNFVNKENERRGYFECHGLHDLIYARHQGGDIYDHQRPAPNP